MSKIFKRKFKTGRIYWININNIKIQKSFFEHPPKEGKYENRLDYFLKRGKYKSFIVLNNHFVLVDGYISYLIAKQFGFVKVPVLFRNTTLLTEDIC